MHRSLILVLGLSLLSSVQTQTQTQTTNAAQTYLATLRCGACINGGWNFCIQADENVQLNVGAAIPASTCCKDDKCSQMNTTGWTCSFSYKDQTMSKAVCPFRREYCTKNGTASGSISLQGNETNLTASTITIISLPPGEVCFYKIKAACNGPRVNITSISNSAGSVERLDYDDQDSANASLQASSGKRLLFLEIEEDVQESEAEDVRYQRELQGNNQTNRTNSTPSSKEQKESKSNSTGKARNTEVKSNTTIQTAQQHSKNDVVAQNCSLKNANACAKFNNGKKLEAGQAKCGTGKTTALIITNTAVQTSRRDLQTQQSSLSMTMAVDADSLSDPEASSARALYMGVLLSTISILVFLA